MPDQKESSMRLALKLLATGEELDGVLTAVIRMVEEQCTESVGSVILLDPDGKHVRHGAAPGLPAEYRQAIDGAEIGPAAGSCGTAIYRREPVIVEDIATDPLWINYREIALEYGLRACWSQPIFAGDRSVLGSFAIYPKQCRKPEPSEVRLIESAAHLAAVAVERYRADQAIRSLNASLEQRVAERTAELEARNHELEQLSEHNRLLAQEVQHRVGNNLTGLIGLVAVMRNEAHDANSFAEAIDARLRAMARVNQILNNSSWVGVDLRALVVSTLDAVQGLARHPVQARMEGPNIPLDSHQTYALALILTEWFTNSCKYGAHSVPGGRLRIAWSIEDLPGGRGIRFAWTERGGPSPPAKITPSLGSLLVKQFSSKDLGGVCEMRFPPAGAEHLIRFPISDASGGT